MYEYDDVDARDERENRTHSLVDLATYDVLGAVRAARESPRSLALGAPRVTRSSRVFLSVVNSTIYK